MDAAPLGKGAELLAFGDGGGRGPFPWDRNVRATVGDTVGPPQPLCHLWL